jgi:ATP-dependent DNA helicase RecG
MKYPHPESEILEFKRNLPQNDQIIKTAIAFCNRSGGQLIIGIDDDRSIVGVDEEKAMELMEYLEQSIYQASSPPIIPSVILQRFGEKQIVVVKISEGMNKPYFRTTEGLEKGIFVRVGRSTMVATADMIEELRWQSRGISFDSMPVHRATLDDLDNSKIIRFLGGRSTKGKNIVSDAVLRSYKLSVEEHTVQYPSVAGILLFGREPNYWFSEAMIICSHFSGTSGRDVIATRDCEGTLLEQFETAYDFVVKNLNRSFVIKGPRRTEQLEIPEEAIREALLNALIHRNYHIRAPIKIAIFDNRVEIFSPGSFPTPFPDFRLGLTDVRNMAICKVFREAGYVEKLGSGLLSIFESCEKRGLATPEIINGERHVKCI